MSQISIRIDDNVKKEAEKVCKDIGISLSSAINIYLKRIGRERRIPFELTAEIPNAKTLAAMRETEEILTHPENYKSYSSFEEILKEVN